MKRLLISIFAVAVGVAMAGPSFAAQQTGNLNVSATVAGGVAAGVTCSMTTTPVTFPSAYSGNGTGLIGGGSVDVNCSTGAPYKVALDAGQNFAAGTRQMSGPGGATLKYELFSSASLDPQFLWGDTGTAAPTHPGLPVSGVGSGANKSHAVSAFINKLQPVTPGAYSDIVKVTVNY